MAKLYSLDESSIQCGTVYPKILKLVKEAREFQSRTPLPQIPEEWLYNKSLRPDPAIRESKQLVGLVARFRKMDEKSVEERLLTGLDKKSLGNFAKKDEEGLDETLETPSRWTETIMNDFKFGAHRKVRESLKKFEEKHDWEVGIVYLFTHIFPLERSKLDEVLRVIIPSMPDIKRSVFVEQKPFN